MSRDFPMDLDVLHRVLNHLNVGVYITDTERRIVLWNRKAQEITGYAAQDVVGSSCHDDVLNHTDSEGRPLCASDLCPLHQAMMAGCAADRPVVVYMKDAEGDRLALEVNVAPLHDDEGRVVGGIETFHDITRRIHDMERAREIQRRLMPRNMPELPGARLQALYRPQDLVGGDIYDVTTLEDGCIDLLLADLRGHGVSAALSTTWLSALRRDIARFAGHPRAYVRALNARLSGRGARSTFATAFYGVYNPRSHRLNYSIAGHPPPLHHHAESGETTRLDGHGMPLGIDADQTYGEDTVELAPGDAVLFYTDGITETFDSEGRPLGTDGLAAALREFLGNDRPHEALYDHVLHRCGPARPDDDVTLMLLQRDGD